MNWLKMKTHKKQSLKIEILFSRYQKIFHWVKELFEKKIFPKNLILNYFLKMKKNTLAAKLTACSQIILQKTNRKEIFHF